MATRIFALLLIMLLTPVAQAKNETVEVIEDWECRDVFDTDWSDILVTAQVFKGREYGQIHVAGVVHDAVFEVEGFNRHWYFGPSEEGGVNFGFTIKPNGAAIYSDFRALTSISSMSCRQK